MGGCSSYQLIEAYGTGIGRIMKAYEKVDKKPMIEATNNAFKITLPNVNAQHEAENDAKRENALPLNADEKAILKFAEKNGSVTRTDVEKAEALNMSYHNRMESR